MLAGPKVFFQKLCFLDRHIFLFLTVLDYDFVLQEDCEFASHYDTADLEFSTELRLKMQSIVFNISLYLNYYIIFIYLIENEIIPVILMFG